MVSLFHVFHEGVGEFQVDLVPCVNDVVITLVVRHFTEVIELGDVLNFCVTFGDELSLFFRNEDVVEVEG